MLTPLEWAIEQLGKGEETGDNDGPFVEKMLREKKRLNWCAAFVLTAFDQAGHPLPGNFYLNRAVKALDENLRKAGAAVPRAYMAPGDIATFDRIGGGHVGVIASVGATAFVCIEGNVANAVRRVHHQRETVALRNVYRWPLQPDVAAQQGSA